jgi:hypothetical protein
MITKPLPRKITIVCFVLLCAASLCAALLCAACSGIRSPGDLSASGGIEKPDNSPRKIENQGEILPVPEALAVDLERITEIERAGAYYPGLALIESGIRENAGDYAGAALAVCKELSWAYGYGTITGKQVEEGLQNALGFIENGALPEQQRNSGVIALRGCIAFVREEWERAEELFSLILSPAEEPDSFLRWMLLVCTLEQAAPVEKIRSARSAYGSIRARYTLFPEYWYRGAKASFSDMNIAATYAEQCINTSPQGPFSVPCRVILSDHFGVSYNGGDLRPEMKTRAEIENIVRVSLSTNDPEMLEELFPLVALPDNPYTLYALGVMKSLSSVLEFRNFFAWKANESSGRLGERLNYISRG